MSSIAFPPDDSTSSRPRPPQNGPRTTDHGLRAPPATAPTPPSPPAPAPPPANPAPPKTPAPTASPPPPHPPTSPPRPHLPQAKHELLDELRPDHPHPTRPRLPTRPDLLETRPDPQARTPPPQHRHSPHGDSATRPATHVDPPPPPRPRSRPHRRPPTSLRRRPPHPPHPPLRPPPPPPGPHPLPPPPTPPPPKHQQTHRQDDDAALEARLAHARRAHRLNAADHAAREESRRIHQATAPPTRPTLPNPAKPRQRATTRHPRHKRTHPAPPPSRLRVLWCPLWLCSIHPPPPRNQAQTPRNTAQQNPPPAQNEPTPASP